MPEEEEEENDAEEEELGGGRVRVWVEARSEAVLKSSEGRLR